MNQRLTAEKFDKLAEGGQRPSHNPRIIWTLNAIAQRIGTGVDFVRDTLVTVEDSPVRQIRGRFYCFEDDLIAFLRSKK